MKKYIIKDEDGKEIEVIETEEKAEEKPAKPAEEKPAEAAHDEPFSPEQIAAIKEIVKEALAEASKPAEEKPAEETPTGDEDIPESEEEKKAKAMTGDSVAKKGPAAVDTTVNDSALIDEDAEIAKAWTKRYNK